MIRLTLIFPLVYYFISSPFSYLELGVKIIFFDGEEAFINWTDEDSLYLTCFALLPPPLSLSCLLYSSLSLFIPYLPFNLDPPLFPGENCLICFRYGSRHLAEKWERKMDANGDVRPLLLLPRSPLPPPALPSLSFVSPLSLFIVFLAFPSIIYLLIYLLQSLMSKIDTFILLDLLGAAKPTFYQFPSSPSPLFEHLAAVEKRLKKKNQ